MSWLVGSWRGAPLAVWRSLEMAVYTLLRARLMPPSGRFTDKVCQGVYDRFSQKVFCAGVSNACAGMFRVATLMNGEADSSHSIVGSSIGMLRGSFCACTPNSKHT